MGRCGSLVLIHIQQGHGCVCVHVQFCVCVSGFKNGTSDQTQTGAHSWIVIIDVIISPLQCQSCLWKTHWSHIFTNMCHIHRIQTLHSQFTLCICSTNTPQCAVTHEAGRRLLLMPLCLWCHQNSRNMKSFIFMYKPCVDSGGGVVSPSAVFYQTSDQLYDLTQQKDLQGLCGDFALQQVDKHPPVADWWYLKLTGS